MSAPNPDGDGDPIAAIAPPPKPRLKINVNRSSSFGGEGASTAAATTAKTKPAETPSSASPPAPPSALASASASVVTPGDGAPRKVKLKVVSTPQQPHPPDGLGATLLVTKAGRQPKPSRKLVESKKRSRSDDEDEDDHHKIKDKDKDKDKHKESRATATATATNTKIKIKPTVLRLGGAKRALGIKGQTTQLVVKPRGRPPYHPPGEGYDSEASDNEIDPAIEEQFVLRMLPGEHCDYVRWCMENGKIGVPKAAGGADLYIRFFEEDSRRGVVAVKGQPFAAVMVDLPTITESMKTWDRKSLLKSADVCQMLLVFAQVKSEEEARHVPLPSLLSTIGSGTSFKWPHGLTPPMHDCVHRRFAKTISRKEIEDKEAEVERLLAEDAKCASTRWEWLDERKTQAEAEAEADDDEHEPAEGEEDAEGEMVDDTMSYLLPHHAAMHAQDVDVDADADADLEADLEAAFADEFAETPATATTPLTIQVETPAAASALAQSIEQDIFGSHDEDDEDQDQDEDEEDEDDDDDDDDEDDEDLDEDQRAARDEEQGVKDIISDLKKQLALRIADFERTQNKILRTRLENQIKQLKSEIQLKQQSIGIEADD